MVKKLVVGHYLRFCGCFYYYCSNSCLVVQNFKIALITIGFIVDLLKILVALKKPVLKKQDSDGFCLARVTNQRDNELESKNEAFYSFSRRQNFHLKKIYIYHVNNCDWIFVKLRMSAT